jgi:dCTP deaminase
MVLSDGEIIARVASDRMIEPFVDHQVGDGVVSYGLSSYGYDFRVANEFKVFRGVHGTVADPKAFDGQSFVDVVTDEFCVIPPNSFALARTVEYFRIPRDIVTICFGKSTYARCGLLLNVTPFEPLWEGHATIGVANTTALPARVYANEGIGQLLFLRASSECLVSYKDRKGRYDRQAGIVPPHVRGGSP